MDREIFQVFYLNSAEAFWDEDGDPETSNEKWIPITEKEYGEFLRILHNRKCIDEKGERIDGKTPTQTEDNYSTENFL